MGLEQYNGMSDEQKLVALLVKMDNIEERFDGLEKRIDDKPCPSPDCLDCRKRITVLEEWKVRRMTELDKESEVKEEEKDREAWVIPLYITIVLALAAFILDLIK